MTWLRLGGAVPSERDPARTRQSTSRPVVLTLIGYYPPAYRAGGPTRSVPRIVELLHDEFEFLVITRDRDLGVSRPLRDVEPDRWVDGGAARCRYVSRSSRLTGGLVRAIRRSRHDVLYLNSLFTVEYSVMPLLLRKLRLIPRRGLVVAPRGELDESALALKRRRKRIYLALARALGLLDDAIWHAADDREAEAVRMHFGRRSRVLIAADIPTPVGPAAAPPPKKPGTLEIVFLSRIAPMKNLDFAIAVLATVRGSVTFDVVGPVEDRSYWAACRALARQFPPSVRLRYRGEVAPSEIAGVLGRHHLFLLPTRGESFGHAIVEALVAGCPVLISDQTPWRDLEARTAGWDLPLSRPDRFREVIERCVTMGQDEFERWSAGARRLGAEIVDDPDRDAAYRAIFAAAAAAATMRRQAEPVTIA